MVLKNNELNGESKVFSYNSIQLSPVRPEGAASVSFWPLRPFLTCGIRVSMSIGSFITTLTW